MPFLMLPNTPEVMGKSIIVHTSEEWQKAVDSKSEEVPFVSVLEKESFQADPSTQVGSDVIMAWIRNAPEELEGLKQFADIEADMVVENPEFTSQLQLALADYVYNSYDYTAEWPEEVKELRYIYLDGRVRFDIEGRDDMTKDVIMEFWEDLQRWNLEDVMGVLIARKDAEAENGVDLSYNMNKTYKIFSSRGLGFCTIDQVPASAIRHNLTDKYFPSNVINM